MPANDYIGRYGDTLRKLTALDQSGGQVAPQQVGAFEQGPAPQQPALAQPQRQPAMQSPAPHPEDGPKVGINDLWRDMPDEHKNQLVKQAQESGMDIDAEYAAHEAEGHFQPTKKKLTIKDKLGRLAEVALKTASNMGRNNTNNSFADYADAQTSVNEKYGALDRAEEQQQRGEFERRRGEKRDDAKERRGRAEHLTEAEGTRTAIAEEGRLTREQQSKEGALNRQNALDLAKLRAAQEKAGKNTQLFMDSESNIFSVVDGKPQPFTVTEKKRTTGKGGSPSVEEVQRQLKGAPKPNANAMDDDAVLRAINERIKLLNEDTRVKSEIKRNGGDVQTEIRKRATAEVLAEANQVKHPSNANAGWKIEQVD